VNQAASQPGTVRVAAIDCGTNSLRLLIADVNPLRAELTDLVRRMEIVRLGQGVDATGMLAADALDRTFRMLTDYARAIKSTSAQKVQMVATSAIRDAGNATEFIRGVTRILGVAPEVLSGDQEARLAFTGATAEFAAWGHGAARGDGAGGDGAAGDDGAGRDGAAEKVGAAGCGAAGTGGAAGCGATGRDGMAGHDRRPRPGPARLAPPYLVTDIGGGSTEFVVGGDGAGTAAQLAAISVDIGCVRLTERHLHSDPPLAAEINAATADIDAALAAVDGRIPVVSARTLVGLAGSVTTVTAIALGLDAYDPARIHHARIPADQVSAVTAELLRLSRNERASISVLHPGRVDVIGAGALVLDRVLRNFGFSEVVASEHDILDGIAWSLAGSGALP
jgi:exopolyphosphatase / guanosine-5'-triphosphate,3'-diphosphate pyrophosphatase